MYSNTGNEYIEKAVRNYSKAMFNAAYLILRSTNDAEDAARGFLEIYIKKTCV
ncbi:MAG: hypothetical protein IKL47_03375 [Clostridia bacterium]|nr:hypothetical protein [Clostridia bacterium]